MKIAMCGLGKMGANMSRRLLNGGHAVVIYDRKPEAGHALAELGAQPADTLDVVVAALPSPRIVWLMVPSGEPTEQLIGALIPRLSNGDILIDGGNSNYKDTQRRAAMLNAQGIQMVDVGTSGGVWGLTEGYSMMIGGDPDVVKHLTPIFETLAPAKDRGWGHVGKSGSGHFVKMVHNGIEYGMMQAYAEGFDVMQAKAEFGLDVEQIARIWQYGSVVRSWLLDLIASGLAPDPSLSQLAPYVPDSGEGRWTVAEAIDLDVPAPVITLALLMRLASRQDNSYAARLLSMMRNQFGGHAARKAE
jgi:6-phosphogluconate dehydrogenase